MKTQRTPITLDTVITEFGKRPVMEMIGVETKILFDGFVRLISRQGKADKFPTVVMNASGSIGAIVLVKHQDGEYSIVTVEQRRYAAVTAHNPFGWIRELVAGRFDKNNATLRSYLTSEAMEEAGIDIDDTNEIYLLNGGSSVYLSVGVMDEVQYYVMAVVDESQVRLAKADETFGLASEGEAITRTILPVREFLAQSVDDVKLLVAKGFVLQYLVKTELENGNLGLVKELLNIQL